MATEISLDTDIINRGTAPGLAAASIDEMEVDERNVRRRALQLARAAKIPRNQQYLKTLRRFGTDVLIVGRYHSCVLRTLGLSHSHPEPLPAPFEEFVGRNLATGDGSMYGATRQIEAYIQQRTKERYRVRRG